MEKENQLLNGNKSQLLTAVAVAQPLQKTDFKNSPEKRPL